MIFLNNSLKLMLKNSEKPIGMFFDTASVYLMECLGRTGLDFVIIDNEHSPIEAIDEIAALDGVDGIFVGPYDLSISMGIPGEFDNPAFQEALDRILSACRRADKFCILFTGNPDGVAAGFKRGFDGMAYSLDAAVFIEAVRERVEKIKSML